MCPQRQTPAEATGRPKRSPAATVKTESMSLVPCRAEGTAVQSDADSGVDAESKRAISALEPMFDLTRSSLTPSSGSDHASGEEAVSGGSSKPDWFCHKVRARSKARSGASWQRISLTERVAHTDARNCGKAMSAAERSPMPPLLGGNVARSQLLPSIERQQLETNASRTASSISWSASSFSKQGTARRLYTVLGCPREYCKIAKVNKFYLFYKNK